MKIILVFFFLILHIFCYTLVNRGIYFTCITIFTILPGTCTSWFLVIPLLSNIYAIIKTRKVIVHSRITHSSKIRQCGLLSHMAHARIENYFPGGRGSEGYLSLSGGSEAFWGVFLLCKFKNFEFSRWGSPTPSRSARSI